VRNSSIVFTFRSSCAFYVFTRRAPPFLKVSAEHPNLLRLRVSVLTFRSSFSLHGFVVDYLRIRVCPQKRGVAILKSNRARSLGSSLRIRVPPRGAVSKTCGVMSLRSPAHFGVTFGFFFFSVIDFVLKTTFKRPRREGLEAQANEFRAQSPLKGNGDSASLQRRSD